MRRKVQATAAIGAIGCGSFLFTPLGCGGGIGPVSARQDVGEGRAMLPESTIARLSECMANHGKPLGPSFHRYHPVIEVDNADFTLKSIDDDIPITAYEFRECTRQALLAMPIPQERYWKTTEDGNDATINKKYMGSPAVVVGVAIAFGEVVLEAGAYTFLFAVTVKVVEKAAEDVAEEGWKAVCLAKYAACVAASARKRGNHWGASRCATCLEACTKEQSWPSHIGNGSCEFWKRNWK